MPEPTPPSRGEPSRSAWPWERRQLAFLRATLVPPADRDARAEIAGALQVLGQKVESFGGRVEALGPLGLVAAFGLEPVEDAPRRAAHAAIAMQRAAQGPRPVKAERVGLKIVIHASPGLVGQAASTPVIDVEATARAHVILEALVRTAEWDTILASQSAARMLERRFMLVPVGLIEPAGGPCYRLDGLEHPGVAPRGAMTPLVGRQSELEQVRHALARAEAGHGQVVALVGEPGVASRGSCGRSPNPTGLTTGWSCRLARSPTARPRPIFRW